jgi:hypothetical protein
MKTQAEIVIKAKAYAKSIGDENGTSAYDYVMGYTQCQEDIANKIQSLIDGYKSYILRLEEKFKDTCSALTLEKIVTLESVIENLESKFNKKDQKVS